MNRRAVTLGSVGHLLLELTGNFLPVTYPLLMPLLGLSFTQVGLIALTHSMCSSLLQPLLGIVAQRWGPERIIALSIAWSGLFMGCIGLAGSFGAVLALAGLGGIGSAAFHPAGSMSVASVSVTRDGRQRRGAAMSFFSVGGNLGSALSPAIIVIALRLFGLPGTGTAAVIGLSSALLIWRLFAYRTSREKTLSGGLKPPNTNHPPKTSPPKDSRSSYHILPVILIVLFAMARSWLHLSIASFLPTWTAQSLRSSAWPLVLMMACVGVGSLSGGRLSDQIGRTRTTLIAALLIIPAHFLFINGPATVQFIALAILGVALGSTLPVTIVMAQERWPHATGLAAGLVIGVGGLPAGIGASVTGLIADAWSLNVALQWTIIAPVIGAVAMISLSILERSHLRQTPPDTIHKIPSTTPEPPPR